MSDNLESYSDLLDRMIGEWIAPSAVPDKGRRLGKIGRTGIAGRKLLQRPGYPVKLAGNTAQRGDGNGGVVPLGVRFFIARHVSNFSRISVLRHHGVSPAMVQALNPAIFTANTWCFGR